MIVADVMRTQLFFLSSETTVREAALALIVNDVESSLVKDENGTIVGLVSERDLLQAVLPDISELMQTGSLRNIDDILELCRQHSDIKVADIMTKKIQTVSPDATLASALGAMLAQRHRRLPVLTEGRAVGTLTQTDLLRQVFVYA